MRVYSKYRNKYRVYRVYKVFGGFANLQRKDPCSVIAGDCVLSQEGGEV